MHYQTKPGKNVQGEMFTGNVRGKCSGEMFGEMFGGNVWWECPGENIRENMSGENDRGKMTGGK